MRNSVRSFGTLIPFCVRCYDPRQELGASAHVGTWAKGGEESPSLPRDVTISMGCWTVVFDRQPLGEFGESSHGRKAELSSFNFASQASLRLIFVKERLAERGDGSRPCCCGGHAKRDLGKIERCNDPMNVFRRHSPPETRLVE